MTAYDNRDEEHAADDDRPDFPGIVSPEMSVAIHEPMMVTIAVNMVQTNRMGSAIQSW